MLTQYASPEHIEAMIGMYVQEKSLIGYTRKIHDDLLNLVVSNLLYTRGGEENVKEELVRILCSYHLALHFAPEGSVDNALKIREKLIKGEKLSYEFSGVIAKCIQMFRYDLHFTDFCEMKLIIPAPHAFLKSATGTRLKSQE